MDGISFLTNLLFLIEGIPFFPFRNNIHLIEKTQNQKMLASICRHYYTLRPLSLDAEFESIQPGKVLARIGLPLMPEYVRTSVGLLHFGVVTRVDPEYFIPLLDTLKKNCHSDLAIASIMGYFQYFSRIHLIHYTKTPLTLVKETSLGEFTFGYEVWSSNKWMFRNPPDFYEVANLPLSPTTILQRSLRTRGTKYYSCFTHNCEHWLQHVAFNKSWNECQSYQTQLALTLSLLCAFVIVFTVFLVLLFTRQREKRRTVKNQSS